MSATSDWTYCPYGRQQDPNNAFVWSTEVRIPWRWSSLQTHKDCLKGNLRACETPSPEKPTHRIDHRGSSVAPRVLKYLSIREPKRFMLARHVESRFHLQTLFVCVCDVLVEEAVHQGLPYFHNWGRTLRSMISCSFPPHPSDRPETPLVDIVAFSQLRLSS